MMTLRRYLAAQYDWTGLASKILRSKAWAIGSLLAVGVIVLALIVFYHMYVGQLAVSDLTDTEFAADTGLEHMFGTMTVFTQVVFLIALFFVLTNAGHMHWMTMHNGAGVPIPLHLYLTEIKAAVVHAITQRRLRDCADKSRWPIHLLLVFGVAVMLIISFFALEWFQTDTIHPIYHPQRWLGYLATAAILIGVGDIVIGRIRKHRQTHRFSDASDWILPIMLLLTVASGIAVHILRITGFASAMHYTYACHVIISVPLVLIEIPFGKLSHMVYRPLAIYFQAVKDKAMEERSRQAEVLSHAS
jgi:nitrate reductase gamma subunit